MKKFKKIIFALVVLIILGAIFNSTNKNDSTTSNNSSSKKETIVVNETKENTNAKTEQTNQERKEEERKEERNEEKQEEKKSSNSIELNKEMIVGKYTIVFTEYKIIKDTNNKPVLRVTYNWKNNDDKSAYPFMTFSLKGFQDKVETDNMVMVLNNVDLGKGQKEIKPGGEIKGAHTIVGIESLDKPLTLELDKSISFKKKPFTVELNLKDIK